MIKAAVVGVGYLGQYHAEKLYRAQNATLECVVDTDITQGKKIAKKWKTKFVQDYRELPLLGVQCATVATPTSMHFDIASFLLAHGVDVLVEKPMTRTTSEARELISIAKKHQRILQIGHLERFNPAFRALKGVLTKPRFFEVRRITPFSGRGIDVDVVLDLMIHDIDIVSHLAQSPLKAVEAVGVPVLTNSIDIANARLTFENGAIANVTASRAAFKSERSIRIFQPEVYISLDYGQKTLKVYTKGKKTLASAIPEISITDISIAERDALEHEISSFIEAVVTRGQPEVSGEDGLQALELADRIREAFDANFFLLGEEDRNNIVVNH